MRRVEGFSGKPERWKALRVSGLYDLPFGHKLFVEPMMLPTHAVVGLAIAAAIAPAVFGAVPERLAHCVPDRYY
jgi:hypothetical protein